MFDGFVLFGQSIANFATPTTIFYALASCLIGLIIGALPGLTATMGVALMTTLTISLPSNVALLILICTYVGAIYGGSRSAILLNIPGTPASAASCLDGYALARQGLAGRAMGIATTGSVLGTWIGMIALAFFTPVLGEAALKFGAYEFFWLAVFGVVISGNLTGNDPLKGWIAGFFGLFIASIGQEGMYAYNRFTFGIHDLSGGIALIPALVGAFGFAEVLTVIKERQPKIVINTLDTVVPRLQDVTKYWRTIIRSGPDRHGHRHRPGRRRGRRGLEFVCSGKARQQGKGKIRQGIDRGIDGGRNRRQCLYSRRRDPGADARGARLCAGRCAACGDADPRGAARPADHGE